MSAGALTYMSIAGEIRGRIKATHGKELFFLPPKLPGDPMKRQVFVSSEVRDCVMDPLPRNWKGRRRAELRARLDAFTRGEQFSVAERPFKKDPKAMLARTNPPNDEIWSLRSTEPKPGIRCFGAFGDKDLFIALTWAFREDINNWTAELARCKGEWMRVFGAVPRLQKGSLNEYISNFYKA